MFKLAGGNFILQGPFELSSYPPPKKKNIRLSKMTFWRFLAIWILSGFDNVLFLKIPQNVSGFGIDI